MIEVEVVAENGIAVASVRVALELLHDGRHYYGAEVGLTDLTGCTRLERAALERMFAEDRRLFPMDYRVPLEQCDAEAAVRVDGGADFAARRATALASSLISRDAARMWQLAANESVRPARAAVRLDLPNKDGIVHARLTIRPQAI
jgi:hypothetical protein